MSKFEHVTTDEAVEIYESSAPIFASILKEVRELSRKKPDATMSSIKVGIVNRVLNDLLSIMKEEPAGKYLEVLNDEALPQMSDAVLTMAQFESALKSFKDRYFRELPFSLGRQWITEDKLAELREYERELEEEYEDEGEE